MTKRRMIEIISVIIVVGLLALWFAAAIINAKLFKLGFSLFDRQTLSIWGLLVLVAFLVFLLNHKTNFSKKVLVINKGLEDSHWLTKKEIAHNKGLTVTKLSELHNIADGVPIHAEQKGNDIEIILSKPTHTLAIGSSGSGKTVTFVDPTVQILSRTKTKPSMVITDPKGELFLHHADSLKKQGYEIFQIDLIEPFRSTRWNVFNDIWKKTDSIFLLEINFNKGKYEFNGKTFDTLELAEKEKKIYIQETIDSIQSDLSETIFTACPIEKSNDPSWQKNARDFILALATAYWEDVKDGWMTRKQFNLFNLAHNISKYCTADIDIMKDYLENREEFSNVKKYSRTVLVSESKTLTSYLGEINSYTAWLADMGICALTSDNDIDFCEFDEKPHALFLKIPDHKESRHKLVTLFITQFYKALVDKAEKNFKDGKTAAAELLRNVYFIMDEFGNMPKFSNVKNILTVGRSRKIFLLPIIQNFSQLDEKYGKEDGSIIRNECLIKIFIQSSSPETIKEFSELCGKHKVKNYSFSEQKDVSVSIRAEQVPLIYPSELQTLNDAAAGAEFMGNAIVLANGRYPLKSKYTPLFAAKSAYKTNDTTEEYREPIIFEQADYYYDIAYRNPFKDELKNTENDIDAVTQQVLSQLASIPDADLMSEEEYNERLIASIHKEIDTLIMSKLKNRVAREILSKLISIDIMSKIDYMDELMNEAFERKDNFLKFDLAYLKGQIEKKISDYPDMSGLSS